MKQVLLMLALAGGVVGCDWREQLNGYQGPKVNPTTLLDKSLSMREAVCRYGINTQQFNSLEDCRKFWRSKDADMISNIREYNKRFSGDQFVFDSDNIKYDVLSNGFSLVMYCCRDVNLVNTPRVPVMWGNKIIQR